MSTLIVIVFFLLAVPLESPASQTAQANLIDANGNKTGKATLTETPAGVVIRLDLKDFPSGTHAFHIHEVGTCDPPSFASAGGHFNPFGRAHGFVGPKGRHAGDLPNIHVPEPGALTVEALAGEATLSSGDERLMDGNGSALMIHAGADVLPAGSLKERRVLGGNGPIESRPPAPIGNRQMSQTTGKASIEEPPSTRQLLPRVCRGRDNHST